MLNDLVFGVTGVWPSDWDCDDDPALTIELEKPRSFNFESLSGSEHLIVLFGVILMSIADRGLRTKLAAFVLEYTFTGKIRGLGGPDGEAMVEYGLSRFKNQVAETDEPLAVLALVTFVEQDRQRVRAEEEPHLPSISKVGVCNDDPKKDFLAR